MKPASHSGADAVNCPACLSRAHREAMYGRSPLDHIVIHSWRFDADHAKAVKARERRQARESALRDLGMVKVRGALGGTYWE